MFIEEKGGEEVGKYMQVGTAAIRSPEGEFMPSVPIYKEVKEDVDEKEYIDENALFDLFAEKCKNYIKSKRNNETKAQTGKEEK